MSARSKERYEKGVPWQHQGYIVMELGDQGAQIQENAEIREMQSLGSAETRECRHLCEGNVKVKERREYGAHRLEIVKASECRG